MWTGNIGKRLASNYINISVVSRGILINQTFLERVVFVVHDAIIEIKRCTKTNVLFLGCGRDKKDENEVDERRLEMF